MNETQNKFYRDETEYWFDQEIKSMDSALKSISKETYPLDHAIRAVDAKLAKETTMTETKTQKNVYRRINAIMGELTHIPKTMWVKMGERGYAATSHDDVTSALQPLFVKHGIVCVPTFDMNEGRQIVRVHFVNIDMPEDMFAVELPTKATFNTEQEKGAAFSYCTKFAMLKVFGLASGDNEEDQGQGTEPYKGQDKKHVAQYTPAPKPSFNLKEDTSQGKLKEQIELQKQVESIFKARGKNEQDALDFMKGKSIGVIKQFIYEQTERK